MLLKTQSNPQMTFQMHLVVKVRICHALASPQAHALFSDCKMPCRCTCMFSGSCTFESILTSSQGLNSWVMYTVVNSCKCALTNGIGPPALIEMLRVLCSPKLLPTDVGKGGL